MATQVTATVLKIGTAPLFVTSQEWSFPTDNIAIEEVVDGDINSMILFSGIKFYVSETKDTLVAAANSGSGGGAPVLQSPDTTLWQIGVNDAGALQTTQVVSGTPGTLHLFSPDNQEWNVTVNNSGALTTTAI